MDLLAGLEATKNVVDRVLIDVEARDVLAYVLLGGIPEKIELGAIGAQDRPVGPDPVKSDGGVIEEVGELALAALASIIGMLALERGRHLTGSDAQQHALYVRGKAGAGAAGRDEALQHR
ncbi:MAG TPA: hypothetical protein VEL28_11410 [Candidatus Binatia bacterium]|nr:hypothetical protein [Candidatus Binatia bacterium]